MNQGNTNTIDYVDIGIFSYMCKKQALKISINIPF